MGDEIVLYRSPFTEGTNSRALLACAAARYTGRPAEELGDVLTNQWGKPAFSQAPEICFSVTHSGNWWLCAFGEQALGLDLQIHRSHTPPDRLSRRFFHPAEDAFLARENYARFFDLWCAKESWVKFTGRGFYDDPLSFSVVSADGAFPAREGVQFRLLPFGPEYSLCLCAPRIGAIAIRDLTQ